MDNIDRTIINLLQRDASLSLNDIAEKINLSATPCWKRIKRLNDEGVIKSRVALIDRNKINLSVSVFVHIKVGHHCMKWMSEFSNSINLFDEVISCYRMAGEWDYFLHVVAKDIPAFDHFYKKLVTEVDGLSDITSTFSMEEIKYTTCLPI